jgi:hypothetical protein
MTDPGARDEADGVFHLMYRSRSTIPDERRKQELGVLFGTARSNNKARSITGALLCVDDCFVQVLEGEETAVQSLFEHIAHDDRHNDVAVLETGPIPERVFSRWAMAKVADEGEPDIPLIAHRDGISPAAGRRTTPEQDRVLDVMRDAARAGATKG